MTSMSVQNLIIGGGASGLAIAADRSLVSPLLVTKPPLGGLITETTTSGGFSFDYGGHVYTDKDSELLEILIKAGAKYHPDRKAFYDVEKRVPYPVQDNADKLGFRIHPESGLTVTNLTTYFYHEFGREFTENFLVPFNRRIWSTAPDEMSFDWVNGRVKRRDEGSKSWGMNSSFYYAPGSQITSVMLDSAIDNGARIIFGALVDIDVDGHKATFNDAENESLEIKYERLFCTTPYFLPHFERNFIASIGIGFEHQLNFAPFDWMYCNLKSYVHRVTWLSRYHPDVAPAGKDSLLLEIPFRAHDKLPDEVVRALSSEDPKMKQFSAALILSHAGFDRHEVAKFVIGNVWGAVTYGYPIPLLGTRREVANIKSKLETHDIYLAGRWGAHGYFNLQHILKDAHVTVAYSTAPTFGAELSDQYHNSSFYYSHSDPSSHTVPHDGPWSMYIGLSS